MPNAQLVTQQLPWTIDRIFDHITARFEAFWEVTNGVRTGGWEGWAPIEIYFQLQYALGQISPDNVLHREKNQIWPYSPHDRIDFWIEWKGDVVKYEGVELKCRNHEYHAEFLMRYLGDITKVEQQPATMPTTLFAVAISIDDQDTTGYQNVYGQVFYTVVENQNRHINIIWYPHTHP